MVSVGLGEGFSNVGDNFTSIVGLKNENNGFSYIVFVEVCYVDLSE